MDEGIKASIKARRDSFDTLYELTDDLKSEVNELFTRIEEFGGSCKDVMDFENKFANSELNQEYINMFTKVATTCTKNDLPEDITEVQSTKDKVIKDIESDIRYYVDDLTYESRRVAREEFDSKLRDTPLGEVEQAANIIGKLNSFRKNIKNNKDK